MILERHWEQIDPLSSLDESYFNDELTSTMFDFIMSGNYKNYYTNHVVIEIYRNTARLFNKNTEEYIGIGFFNTNENEKQRIDGVT
jgi:hypothetical protein